MKYILIILLYLPSITFACSFEGDPTGGVPYEERVIRYIESAEYLFVGKVEEYEWKSNPQWTHDRPWHFHRISIIEQFKGDLDSSIEYWPASSCSQVFSEVGEKFVFFGRKVQGSIQFTLMSGSTAYWYENEIGLIEKLRKLRKESSNKLLHPTANASAE